MCESAPDLFTDKAPALCWPKARGIDDKQRKPTQLCEVLWHTQRLSSDRMSVESSVTQTQSSCHRNPIPPFKPKLLQIFCTVQWNDCQLKFIGCLLRRRHFGLRRKDVGTCVCVFIWQPANAQLDSYVCHCPSWVKWGRKNKTQMWIWHTVLSEIPLGCCFLSQSSVSYAVQHVNVSNATTPRLQLLISRKTRISAFFPCNFSGFR